MKMLMKASEQLCCQESDLCVGRLGALNRPEKEFEGMVIEMFDPLDRLAIEPLEEHANSFIVCLVQSGVRVGRSWVVITNNINVIIVVLLCCVERIQSGPIFLTRALRLKNATDA